MIKIGITGQAGFVGKHIYNTLGLFTDKYERIPFEKSFFDDVDEYFFRMVNHSNTKIKVIN